MKRIIATLLGVLASTGVWASTAQAEADPWKVNAVLLEGGQKVDAIAWGKVVYKVVTGEHQGEIVCHNVLGGIIVNEVRFGESNTGVFRVESWDSNDCVKLSGTACPGVIRVTNNRKPIHFEVILSKEGSFRESSFFWVKDAGLNITCYETGNEGAPIIWGDKIYGKTTDSWTNGTSALHPTFEELFAVGSEALTGSGGNVELEGSELKILGSEEQQLITLK